MKEQVEFFECDLCGEKALHEQNYCSECGALLDEYIDDIDNLILAGHTLHCAACQIYYDDEECRCKCQSPIRHILSMTMGAT